MLSVSLGSLSCQAFLRYSTSLGSYSTTLRNTLRSSQLCSRPSQFVRFSNYVWRISQLEFSIIQLRGSDMQPALVDMRRRILVPCFLGYVARLTHWIMLTVPDQLRFTLPASLRHSRMFNRYRGNISGAMRAVTSLPIESKDHPSDCCSIDHCRPCSTHHFSHCHASRAS